MNWEAYMAVMYTTKWQYLGNGARHSQGVRRRPLPETDYTDI